MKRLWKITAAFALCFSLSACANKNLQQPKLVNAIYISGIHQNAPLSCFYSDPKKMEAILYYLRSLDDLGKPKQDPERIMGDRFKITVFFTDGTTHIYRQQADRFLSRNDKPWRTVDERRASMLYPLLTAMPADQPSAEKVT